MHRSILQSNIYKQTRSAHPNLMRAVEELDGVAVSSGRISYRKSSYSWTEILWLWICVHVWVNGLHTMSSRQAKLQMGVGVTGILENCVKRGTALSCSKTFKVKWEIKTLELWNENSASTYKSNRLPTITENSSTYSSSIPGEWLQWSISNVITSYCTDGRLFWCPRLILGFTETWSQAECGYCWNEVSYGTLKQPDQ